MMPVALPPTGLGGLDLWADRRISVLLSESDEVLAKDKPASTLVRYLLGALSGCERVGRA